MSDSQGYLDALNTELEQAGRPLPGGQVVEEGRVQAIKDEIARVEGVLANAVHEVEDIVEHKEEPKPEEKAAEPQLKTVDAKTPVENADGPKA